MHSYLDAHPAIGMSQVKELNYFVDQYNWGRGIEWYRSWFDPELPVRGESSPMYAMRPATPERVPRRIHALAPTARIVYLVRDPVERVISHYEHARTVGVEFRPIAEALADLDCDYVTTSRYRFQLEPYLELFGEDRILVVSQDSLRDDRAATLERVFGFLGVDAAFRAPEFEREWMVTAGRGTAFHAVKGFAARLGLRGAWARMPPRARWLVTRALSRRTTVAAERAEPGAELRERLAEALAPDAKALRELTGESYTGWAV